MDDKLFIPEPWITLQEAAELYKIHPKTLQRWCSEGKIDPQCGKKVKRTWRFNRDFVMRNGIIFREDDDDKK